MEGFTLFLTESGLDRTWKAKLLDSLEQKDKLSTSIDDDDKHLLPLESFFPDRPPPGPNPPPPPPAAAEGMLLLSHTF